MFDRLFNFGCGHKTRECNTSCDVLWIIILLLILTSGGIFGMDICTIVILLIVFGGGLFGGKGGLFGGKGCCERQHDKCC